MNVWWRHFGRKPAACPRLHLYGLISAAAAGPLNWPVAVLTVVTATLLQILSNLANDYGDAVHGVDDGTARPEAHGAIRPDYQSGDETRHHHLCPAGDGLRLAMVLYLFGLQNSVLVLVFLALGGGAVWAAIAYTASKNPYGYMGLGICFVLIFLAGGHYRHLFLQTLQFDWILFLPATSVGLCAVAVLNINNIRDIDTGQSSR